MPSQTIHLFFSFTAGDACKTVHNKETSIYCSILCFFLKSLEGRQEVNRSSADHHCHDHKRQPWKLEA